MVAQKATMEVMGKLTLEEIVERNIPGLTARLNRLWLLPISFGMLRLLSDADMGSLIRIDQGSEKLEWAQRRVRAGSYYSKRLVRRLRLLDEQYGKPRLKLWENIKHRYPRSKPADLFRVGKEVQLIVKRGRFINHRPNPFLLLFDYNYYGYGWFKTQSPEIGFEFLPRTIDFLIKAKIEPEVFGYVQRSWENFIYLYENRMKTGVEYYELYRYRPKDPFYGLLEKVKYVARFPWAPGLKQFAKPGYLDQKEAETFHRMMQAVEQKIAPVVLNKWQEYLANHERELKSTIANIGFGITYKTELVETTWKVKRLIRYIQTFDVCVLRNRLPQADDLLGYFLSSPGEIMTSAVPSQTGLFALYLLISQKNLEKLRRRAHAKNRKKNSAL